MKNKMLLQEGVSVLEIVIALSIMSIVSVASVWLVFISINLRDQALATIKTSEALRVFGKTLHRSVAGATVVTGDANSLFLTSATECWSFIYDAVEKNVRYDQKLSSGCSPNQNPTNLFFPVNTFVSSLNFTVGSLATGGRQVTVNGVVHTILPFQDYLINFTDTITNVID